MQHGLHKERHYCEKCGRQFHNNWGRLVRGKQYVQCPEFGGCGHMQIDRRFTRTIKSTAPLLSKDQADAIYKHLGVKAPKEV